MTHPLILPMLIQMSLALVILFTLAFRRISAVKKAGGIAGLRKAGGFSARILNMSDNLKNQFEMPVIFYALSLLFIFSGETPQSVVIAAWVFVAFRVVHSVVHCTTNVIFPTRFLLFLISVFALIFMLASALMLAAGGAG